MADLDKNSMEAMLKRLAGTDGWGWRHRAASALSMPRTTLGRYIKAMSDGTPERIPAEFWEVLAASEPVKPAIAPPSCPDMLRGFARGLVALQEDLDGLGFIRAPYPDALLRSFNLAAAMRALMLPGASRYPIDLAELLDRAKEPLFRWIPTLDTEPFDSFLGSRLMDGHEITRDCMDLANIEDGDAETAYYQFLLQRCQSLSNEHRQALYVAWRSSVINHPVAESHSALLADPTLRRFPQMALELIQFFYDVVPASQAVDGHLLLCPVTGTRLRQSNGEWATESRNPEIQRKLVLLGPVRRPYTSQFIELKRAVRQFWTLPGRYELDLAERAKQLGWSAELWPGLDAVDLVLSHPKKRKRFAIDVKDHISPMRLARSFEGFSAFRHHERLIVVPDYLATLQPRYSELFGRAREDAGKPAVILMTTSKFLDRLESSR